MEWFVPLIALVAVLFLVGRGMPGQMYLIAIAGALVLVVIVVWLERSDLWPSAWRVP